MQSALKRYFLVAAGALSIGWFAAISEDIFTQKIDSLLPEIGKIDSFSRPGTITILSTNGKIIQKLGPATREKIDKHQIPVLIKQAFIASEDRRFYIHRGVDFWSITRALMKNVSQLSVIEGGSTISQQLARIIFLSQEESITRKIKEAALAFKIERTLSKEEILRQYLNNVYLGSNAYGISDASWIYFSKSPDKLNLSEVALIAGLAPAPSVYSPLVNIDLATRRRDIVLERMFLEGYISKQKYNDTLKSKVSVNPAPPKFLKSEAPFFTSWISRKLPELISKEHFEVGGITVKTSLNLDWQKKAQKTIRDFSYQNIEGAVVSIEPSSGFVRILVGGKNFDFNEFNRATQAFRSPGSTFKIITYAAALKRGITPSDIFEDRPKCWGEYCPKNFRNKYLGKVSILDSFKYSLNTISVELLHIVGFENVISLANDFGIGIERKLEKYYPLAVGALEESVINMTAAYAALANGGIYNKPTPFEQIIGPDGKIIWEKSTHGQASKRVINQEIASTINKMLIEVVNQGTGKAAIIPGEEVAGKTGTSEGARDIWFIGSLSNLSTGIWFGYDNSMPTKNSSGTAAYAWKKLMKSISNE